MMVGMARPITHTEELRSRLLAEAVRLVASKGVAVLSLRDVAAAAGTSTTAIYSLFGGKRELLSAVVDDGFRSFAGAQKRAAPQGLLALGRAYRDWALAHPLVYSLMFAGSAGSVVDCSPDQDAAEAAMGPLLDAVLAALAARPAEGSPQTAVAAAIWGQVHGLVSLELAGTPPPGGSWAEAYEVALAGIARAWLRP